MKNTNKEEDLFHLFIQYADKLPSQAAIFPYFDFMDQSIRKNFNQLKRNMKKDKDLQNFDEFWHELTNQDKVRLYCNWVILLKKSLELEKNVSLKLQPESLTIQDQIYIKKVNFFNKWQKKIAKLTPTHLHITGRKTKQYQLKHYQIRKSRSKQNFSWVLQPINNFGKTLHCGVGSQSMFDEWYYALTVNINNQRVEYFLNYIKHQKINPGSTQRKGSDLKKQELPKLKPLPSDKQKGLELVGKTLTQIMIDKQMKNIDNDNFTQVDQNDEFQSLDDKDEAKEEQFMEDVNEKKEKPKEQQKKSEQESNPNIFRRLAPQYKTLMNFADTPFNSALIHCDSEYRIYQLPQRDQQEIVLKMFTVFPYSKSLIFEAIVSEAMGWNDEIDTFTVKTKISSENTVLIYEKNKAQGILYRERDFLYLRHCFSVLNMKQKNTFIIDKSIDSIHHPPFMSVVRAEKKLIWGLIQKQKQKQCILIIEGWVKGGGYMNQMQNKEMTIKFMRKLNNLRGFLKQLSFTQNNKNNLFKQDWGVDFNKQDQPSKVYTQSSDRSQKQQQQNSVVQKFQVDRDQKEINEKKQMQQFMKRTQQQNAKNAEGKSEVYLSDQRIDKQQQYVPPEFDKQKFVIIPQQYAKRTHAIAPLEKSKKPKLYPHVRGHHLWKGQWQILPTGGLGYIDQEKMKEQKKVLTYIIKRIGKNIFSGKGILNISLPVDIFCVQSNIEKLATSFGYFPFYLQKAAEIKQPHIQLKYVVGSGIASSIIYITMEKPFNPILGQTYQCWIDGCPVYFQQISHHPPIAAFMMKGRGYTVSGSVQAKMDLSINSGTGINEGIFTVEFQNGNTFYYTTPSGCLSGLTYGDRKLNLIGKSYYWNANGLFLQITYNPGAKTKGFFSGVKGEGDEKLPDFIEGYIKQYHPDVIKEIAFKTVGDKLVAAIPKGGPTASAIKTHGKIYGRWNKYVKYGDQTLFDVDQNRYYATFDEKYPLPSHSNYRQDIVYRRMRNFIVSQQFKQILEVKQREDRKLRAKFGKHNSH